METRTRIAVLLLAAFGCGGAAAQTVYRCGNYYSQKPCAGGSAVDTSDRRSAAQAADAADASRRTAKAADTLEKDRLAQEKRAAPPVIVANSPRAGASAPDGGPNVIKGKQPKAGKSKQATAVTGKEHAEAGEKKAKPKKKPAG